MMLTIFPKPETPKPSALDPKALQVYTMKALSRKFYLLLLL